MAIDRPHVKKERLLQLRHPLELVIQEWPGYIRQLCNFCDPNLILVISARNALSLLICGVSPVKYYHLCINKLKVLDILGVLISAFNK